MTAPPASIQTTDLSLELVVRQALGSAVATLSDDVFEDLARDIAAIDARLQSVLGATYPRLTEAANYACRTGGKRIRPLLMAVTTRALGAPSTGAIHSLAAAFQLIHTASLVHDDVIDHAELRRGKPSLAQAFGLPTAIVAGDYLFVRAFELAAEYPRTIILRCGEACADLAEGEVLQELSRFDLTTGPERYFRVIERKTASIVAAGLASVAEITGAMPATVDALAAYGKAVGIAFQLSDDLLDIYGDPDLLGKPVYSDLREGNPTFLSLAAYDALDGRAKSEFEKLFTRQHKRTKDLLRLRSLIEATGAAETVRREATRWAARAERAVEPVPGGPFRTLLIEIARGAARRKF